MRKRPSYPLADMFGSDRGDDILMDTVSRMYTYARSPGLRWNIG